MNATDPVFLEHALAVARTAAAAAAEVIRRHYAGGVAVDYKADATPVTRADIESEQAIRACLRAAFPDHAILGEEEGRQGAGEFLWLVDPIDGTRAFVRGYPLFSTQIALMHRGRLLLGVSCAPVFGESMWARRGGGAFLEDAAGLVRPARLAALPAAEQRALSTGNLKTLAGTRGWAVLGEVIGGLGRIRGYGDFLHYHLLARGAIDGVLESDVNILDVAALAVIVEEAGGVFSDLDGLPPGLDTRSVLAAGPAFHGELLERFRGWRDG